MDIVMTQDGEREQAAPDGAVADAPSLRRCIVTRDALEKDRLIRFVLGPDDQIVPDLAGKLPGRGAWVRAERKVLAEAVKKNAFGRAMQASVQGAPVKVAPDLVDRVAALLDRQIVDLIGLARRSGVLVTGFEKVNAALQNGKAVLLIEASDAGKDGRGKLARHTLPGVEIWSPLTAEMLGRAIGRDHAVHVAVGQEVGRGGGLAKRLKAALRRQSGFRPGGISEDERTGAVRAAAPAKPRTDRSGQPGRTAKPE